MNLNDPTINRIHGHLPFRYRVAWTGYHTRHSGGVVRLERDTFTLRGARRLAQRIRDGYYSGQEVK